MISEADISQALGQRLATMAGAPPIAWENKDLPIGTAYPYLVVQVVRVSRTDPAIAGGLGRARGYMTVTVVDEVDKWATDSERLADDISDRFAYPLTLDVTGGKITIMQPPLIQQGFRDGPRWRLPVRIDYQAY